MYAAQYTLLGQAITAANNWRTTANSVGVALEQINLRFPDGKSVLLFWDQNANDGAGDWTIDT